MTLIDVTINTETKQMSLDDINNLIMSGAFSKDTKITIKAEYGGEMKNWEWNGRTDHYEKWTLIEEAEQAEEEEQTEETEQDAEGKTMTLQAIEMLLAATQPTSQLDDIYDWLYGAYWLGEAQQDEPSSKIRPAFRHYEAICRNK